MDNMIIKVCIMCILIMIALLVYIMIMYVFKFTVACPQRLYGQLLLLGTGKVLVYVTDHSL